MHSGFSSDALSQEHLGHFLHENDTFIELVKEAQRGNQEAFGEIYEELINDIYRYVVFKTPSAESSDITSDIFLKAWEHVRKFSGENKSQFRAWIFTIAHNCIVDFYRSRKEHSSLDEAIEVKAEEDTLSPTQYTEEKLSQEHLGRAIAKLPKNYKEIVVLRYINGLSHREIAQILKKSEENIRTSLHRAKKRLEELLQE